MFLGNDKSKDISTKKDVDLINYIENLFELEGKAGQERSMSKNFLSSTQACERKQEIHEKLQSRHWSIRY